jgi:hypothetical protein
MRVVAQALRPVDGTCDFAVINGGNRLYSWANGEMAEWLKALVC